MTGDPGQRALQQMHLARAVARATAALVREGDHAVYSWVVAQGVTLESLGDGAHGAGRAVHRGDHRDVVTRAHTAVGAPKALEGATLGLRDHRHRTRIHADGIVV